MDYKDHIWCDTDNASWKTNLKLKCCHCRKHNNFLVEIITKENKNLGLYCFLNPFRDCFVSVFKQDWSDYVHIRSIEYIKLEKKTKSRTTGLSLRYRVLKRDNFKCVFCGSSSKDDRLEIDHIVPYSSGGETVYENLQTLCFKCNRGKRDYL